MFDIKSAKKTLRHLSLRYGLEDHALVLVAGSALLFHGLRKVTDDLDVNVELDTLTKILPKDKLKWATSLSNLGVPIPIYPKVDIHYSGSIDPETLVVIEGITVLNLPALLKQKEVLYNLPGRTEAKRSQDLKDIANIKRKL